jgi:hypothetical protein
MKSIVFILPYFGKWPIWFDAFLVSISNNSTVNWLIITDCKIPQKHPVNIRFIATTLNELNEHINIVVDANVPLTPRKFCDLKPAYGEIFSEEIKNYDFWGICDMDIIWGDIRKFITHEHLSSYDIISTLEDMVSGHFTLFRNNETINSLYHEIENYKILFEQPKFMWFDEHVYTNFLKTKNNYCIKVFWDKDEINKGMKSEVHQEYFLDRWHYEDGKIYDLHSSIKKEYMYLHFINWKNTMKKCEVNYIDNINKFYISYSGILYKKHTSFEIIYNNLIIFFNGYFRKEWRRLFIKRIKSYKKRINF